MDEERTVGLLDDLLASDQAELTTDAVDEAGGRDEVIRLALD